MTPGKSDGPDSRAVAVARQLRDSLDAECVILFGPRARGDYREPSDIDLIVITSSEQDSEQKRAARRTTGDIIKKNYGRNLGFDHIFLTPGQYQLKSRQTLNHAAGAAWKEGIFMPRNPGEYGRRRDEEEFCDYAGDYTEEGPERKKAQNARGA